MYQQNQFQGNTSYGQTNTNRYQPSGFVQSHYQGQLTRSAASGPVTAHSGYQAGGSQGYGTTGSAFTGGYSGSSSMGSFTGGMTSSGFQGQAVTQQNPVYNATNARQQDGPVIQHLGYQAGTQQGFQGGQFGTPSFQSAGGFQGQATTQQNPVYRATNARQQEGPVIQHTGYQSGVTQGYGMSGSNQGMGMVGQSFQGQAMTQQNPVYNATNARQQDGPVIQHLGYQAGTQQGFGSQGMGMSGNQNRYSF
jgi:hypothetical protein